VSEVYAEPGQQQRGTSRHNTTQYTKNQIKSDIYMTSMSASHPIRLPHQKSGRGASGEMKHSSKKGGDIAISISSAQQEAIGMDFGSSCNLT
jgi:hypothetical protein